MFTVYMPDILLIGAAAVPAAALFIMVYRLDRAEAEPPGLLFRLALMGILATAVAKLAERAGIRLLDGLLGEAAPLYDALLYFGVVGFSEEGAKYALLKRATWRSPAYNSRFDGVVYGASVSLGFALWENLGYVLTRGLGTAMLRAVTAIPGHACFGVFMGCWYARAKVLERRGDLKGSRAARVWAVVLPAALHGAYDFIAAAVTPASGWVFFTFVSALFIVTCKTAVRLARQDGAINQARGMP